MYLLILQRYFIFGILGIEALLVPMLLEPYFYGELEYIRSFIFLSQFAFLGACSGYITIYYKYNIDLLGDLKFITLCCGFMTFLIAIAFGGNSLVGLSCVVVIIAFYIETMAKLNKNYLIAIMYKPLFSLFLVIVALVLWKERIKLESPVYVVSICAALSLLSYIIISYWRGVNNLSFSGINFDKNNIRKLLKEGLIVNAATALIVINLFADRTWIRAYYLNQLPDYSFAINISQFVILAITTFSLVNQVELGETFRNQGVDGLKEALKRRLQFSAKVYVFLIIVYLPFLYILLPFVKFPNFVPFALVTGVLFGLSQLLFSINIALVYMSKFYIVVLLCFVSLLLNLVVDYYIASLNVAPIWLLVSSYVSFIGIGMVVLIYLFKSKNKHRFSV